MNIVVYLRLGFLSSVCTGFQRCSHISKAMKKATGLSASGVSEKEHSSGEGDTLGQVSCQSAKSGGG